MNGKVNPAAPETIPKFVTKLVKPPVARPKNVGKEGKEALYKLTMREATHRFHKDFPPTSIWGYDGLYPGPTIEAQKDEITRVQYINKLPTKHFLPVDTTLHSADHSAEVRTVTHLHGAHVDWESDGHPEAWYTKNYAATGKNFRRQVHEYTNNQPAATLWYHDHAMALTRLNVYAGLAGFYLLRDTMEQRLNLPKDNYEIPLLLQDKSFNEDGSLFYPDAPPFPVDVHPSITPGFVGNTIVVNGKVWPYLSVEPRKYRFRVLNGSNRRAYTLQLSNDDSFTQIGTDGGFVDAPFAVSSIELLPAERVDLIIDFSNLQGETITLLNTDEEFTNEYTREVLQFRVDLQLKGTDTNDIPAQFMAPMPLHEEHAHTVRHLSLVGSTDFYGRPMLLLDNHMYHEPVTEKPARDTIEVWNFVNTTAFPHPIHIHLVQFQILERRPFDVARYELDGTIIFTEKAVQPHTFEMGWKDTVKANPGMVTKVIMHWKDFTGNYMWHCHVLEHEDHDMMRPILVLDDVHPIQHREHGE